MLELLTPAQLGIPGGPELLVILLIAVLLFGANKIPKLARSTGEAMGEFQKGREEVEQELNEMRQGKTKDSTSESTTGTTTESSTTGTTTETSTTDPSTTEEPTTEETETETERTEN